MDRIAKESVLCGRKITFTFTLYADGRKVWRYGKAYKKTERVDYQKQIEVEICRPEIFNNCQGCVFDGDDCSRIDCSGNMIYKQTSTPPVEYFHKEQRIAMQKKKEAERELYVNTNDKRHFRTSMLDAHIVEITELLKQGYSTKDISDFFGKGQSTIYSYIKSRGLVRFLKNSKFGK